MIQQLFCYAIAAVVAKYKEYLIYMQSKKHENCNIWKSLQKQIKNGKKVFEFCSLCDIITTRLWTGCINLSWYNYQTLRRYKTNGKQMGIFV